MRVSSRIAVPAAAIKSCFDQRVCQITFYYRASCMWLPRAIIAAPRCRGERQQRRSYLGPWPIWGQSCHCCKRAGDFDSMKTASRAGSGRTCILQPNRLWRKPAACKLQDDHEGQSTLMQWNRWEKRWSYEKLQMKTKQIFGKTFQKKVRGVGILLAAGIHVAFGGNQQLANFKMTIFGRAH